MTILINKKAFQMEGFFIIDLVLLICLLNLFFEKMSLYLANKSFR